MTSKSSPVSNTAHKVLAAAVARADRLAVEPAKLPRAACSAVARTLLRAGWVERTDAETGALWYPEPGRATGPRVTEASLRAIGLKPEPTLTSAEDLPAAGQGAPTTAAVPEAAPEPTASVEAAQGALTPADALVMEGDSGTTDDTGSTPTLPQAVGRNAGSGLRRAAQDVMHAWDDEASQRAGLPEAVERLPVLLAGTTATRPSTAAPRHPREGTKQAQVLALLRRPEGASGPQIADAIGWAPHTVRGFLAGLSKKGVPVTVLERVRQVGPDKAGAKGSYTVYHIADAG